MHAQSLLFLGSVVEPAIVNRASSFAVVVLVRRMHEVGDARARPGGCAAAREAVEALHMHVLYQVAPVHAGWLQRTDVQVPQVDLLSFRCAFPDQQTSLLNPR